MMSSNKPFEITEDGSTIKLSNGLLAVGCGNILLTGDQTISGITNGKFTTIEITKIDGLIYKYQILVIGSGSGSHFAFTDQSPDTYNLSVYSPVVENHYVDYNSDHPDINYIKIDLG